MINNSFNPLMPGVHKMVKHTLKIMHHFQQNFYPMFDHFVDTTHYMVTTPKTNDSLV